MKKLKKYYSGLSGLIKKEHLGKTYKGKGWEVSFEELKEQQNRSATFDGEKEYPHKDIVVKAENSKRAKEIFRLIYACWVIVRAGDIVGIHDIGDYTEETSSYFAKKKERVLDSQDLDTASFMASKASSDIAHVYAIHKLNLSMTLFFIPFVDIDPYLMTELPPKPTMRNCFPIKDVMIMSCAIVMAYSAIEEIGLRTPSKWTEKNERQLHKSLKDLNINPTKTVSWQLRGTKTFLEKSIPNLRIVKKSKWSKGPIRDIEIELAHAIYCASFLRSKVSAHSFVETEEKTKRIKTLSIDDVLNVQYLSRQLILEKLGIWRKLLTV